MLAIVLDDDQHSQKVLTSLLHQLGYYQVLQAHGIEEFDFYCNQHPNIRLIVSGFRLEEGLDLPITRVLLKYPTLHTVPLVFMTNSRLRFNLNFKRARYSRIDSYLHRPFGLEALRIAIGKAHARRGLIRNVLLIYGKQTTGAIEATYRESNTSHWKETVFAETFADLKNKYKEYAHKIGGILFDPNHAHSPQLEGFLNRIRKEPMGSTLVIGVLGQTPKEIHSFRVHSDLFFEPNLSWPFILEQLSAHFLSDWQLKNHLKLSKELLKLKKPKKACALLQKDRTLPNTWQKMELQGLIEAQLNHPEKSQTYFLKALDLNPCAPSIYLHLLQTLSDTEKEKMAQKALEYCPNHPQIREMTGAILK